MSAIYIALSMISTIIAFSEYIKFRGNPICMFSFLHCIGYSYRIRATSEDLVCYNIIFIHSFRNDIVKLFHVLPSGFNHIHRLWFSLKIKSWHIKYYFEEGIRLALFLFHFAIIYHKIPELFKNSHHTTLL